MDDLLSTLMSMMDEEGPQQESSGEQEPAENGFSLDPEAIMKMASVMEELSKDSDDTRLLYALRPYLRPQRQAKVEQAATICRLMRIMPKLMGGSDEKS